MCCCWYKLGTHTITNPTVVTKKLSKSQEAKPTKALVVSQTKRANNRLKVIGETCWNLAQRRDTRQPERVHKLINARLDRELTLEDSAGQALRDAVRQVSSWEFGIQRLLPLWKPFKMKASGVVTEMVLAQQPSCAPAACPAANRTEPS